MGARAQIKVNQGPVYLYTHHGSGEILKTAQKGMKMGEPRWHDPEYLTRILFDAMKGNDTDSTTGYGIGVQMHGDIDCYVAVDCSERKVSYHQYQNEVAFFEWSFEEFINANLEEYNG